MEIKRITYADDRVVKALKRMLPQLTGREENPTMGELEEILANEMTHMFVAVDGDEIVGSLTLALYRIPTSLKGIIEDVVVDESARGRGVASKLMQRAIDNARENGVSKIELTSRPTRIAANKMYRKFGFEVRDTNFYRLDL